MKSKTRKAAGKANLDPLVLRYRRRRSSTVWHYNARAWDAEPGDLMVTHDGILYRLTESSGWGKREAGELTPRTIKPPHPGLFAVIHEDEVWWAQNNRVERLPTREGGSK